VSPYLVYDLNAKSLSHQWDKKAAAAESCKSFHFKRGGTLTVTVDDFKFASPLVILENRGVTKIEDIYTLCDIRGGPESRIEGELVSQVPVPWLNWDDEIIEGSYTLMSGRAIKISLAGISSSRSTKNEPVFAVLTGQKNAQRVSEPKNALIFEYVMFYKGGGERIIIAPVSVDQNVARFSFEINSVTEVFEVKLPSAHRWRFRELRQVRGPSSS
jgi:hypothetical protein